MARYFDPKVWRPIPGFENYVCDRDGNVANRDSGVVLVKQLLNCRRSKVTGEEIGTRGYTLHYTGHYKKGKHTNVSVVSCIRRAWPDLPTDHIVLDDVKYRQCFPGNDWYYISQDGVLVNHRYNDRRIAIKIRKDGGASARVSIDGRQSVVDIDDLVDAVWFGVS